jgi:hypothetical protein
VWDSSLLNQPAHVPWGDTKILGCANDIKFLVDWFSLDRLGIDGCAENW